MSHFLTQVTFQSDDKHQPSPPKCEANGNAKKEREIEICIHRDTQTFVLFCE
jgi:hypothetical protein